MKKVILLLVVIFSFMYISAIDMNSSFDDNKFYCKYCGEQYYSNVKCNLSPTKKHIMFEGRVEKEAKYYCKKCGLSFDSLKRLCTAKNCTNKNDNPHYPHHIVFEGTVYKDNQKFVCKHCGQETNIPSHFLRQQCPKRIIDRKPYPHELAER